MERVPRVHDMCLCKEKENMKACYTRSFKLPPVEQDFGGGRFNWFTGYSVTLRDATARGQGRNLQAGLEVTS